YVAFIADKEMRAVFHHRSAECAAESLGRIRRPVRRKRGPIVEDAGLAKEKGRTLESVRSRIGDRERDRRERFAELRRELTGQHLHFANAFQPIAGVKRAGGAAPLREMARAVHDDVVAPVDLTLRAWRNRIAGETGGERC